MTKNNAIAVIPVGGLGGKKRLLKDNGGLFSENQIKLLIKSLIIDLYGTLTKSKIFDRIVIGTPKKLFTKEMEEFFGENNIDFHLLIQETFNLQLREISQEFQCYKYLLLISSDLPLVTENDIVAFYAEIKKHMIHKNSAVVLAPSKRLGCASIFISPLSYFIPELNLARSNLLFNLKESHAKNINIFKNFNLYFDIDLPEDLYEIFYLLQINKYQSKTLEFLLKNKWDFIVPDLGTQDNILKALDILLKEKNYKEIVQKKNIVKDGIVYYSIIEDDTAIIFLTTSDLYFELLNEIKNLEIKSTCGYSFQQGKIHYNNKTLQVRICLYGVYCDKVGKVLLKSLR